MKRADLARVDVVIYPCGRGGVDVLEYCKNVGLKYILADDDKQKVSDGFFGEQVVEISHILEVLSKKDIAVIVNSEKYGTQIIDKLTSSGCTKVYDFATFQLENFKKQIALLKESKDPKKPVVAFFDSLPPSGRLGSVAKILVSRGYPIFYIEHLKSRTAHIKNDVPVIMLDNALWHLMEGVDIMLSSVGMPNISKSIKLVCFSHGTYASSGVEMTRDGVMEFEYLSKYKDVDYFVTANYDDTIYYREVMLLTRRKMGDIRCKAIIPAGETKLDENIVKYEQIKQEKAKLDTIIYAPGYVHRFNDEKRRYHENNSFPEKTCEIIEALAKAFPSHKIACRLHPTAFGRKEIFDNILATVEQYDNIYLDNSHKDHIYTYQNSAVLVTDTSNAAYSFAYIALRPVVFLNPVEFPDEITSPFGGKIAIGFVKDRKEVGYISPTIDDMIAKVSLVLDGKTEFTPDRLRSFRDSRICNIMNSASYIADNIENIYRGFNQKDWACL